jgi:radical SAM protein with 4Fe4S-binding SPASM domain
VKHLVIKPTISCTADCPTCGSRRTLHRDLRSRPQLTLDQWGGVIADARRLGTWHLTISGGEPTLYPELVELVRIAKSHGLFVRMNTNGSFDGPRLAGRLLDAGLDVVDVSLYSASPSRLDQMRGHRGLWEKATRNIELLHQMSAEHPGFQVITQTILSRQNCHEFAELLELDIRLGSSGLLVSYLEGDFEGQHRISKAQIEEFRNHVVPLAVDACRNVEPFTRRLAASAVKRLFSPELLDADQWATGEYRPAGGPCTIPSEQALVLANGDVHPCNIVEYTHLQTVGNVLTDSLTDIWSGPRWNDFRASGIDECRLCPMERHVFIPLKSQSRATACARVCLATLGLENLERPLHRLAYRFRNRSRP